MHRILFIDHSTPYTYDGNTLHTQPQGGSESSLTRVAEALARRGHHVRVTQKSRAGRATVNGVEHTPLRDNGDFTPTHIVAFREAMILDHALKQWPGARGYAWYQDFHEPGGRTFVPQVQALLRNRSVPILVSDWHELLWIRDLQTHGYPELPTERIYNAIPDDLCPDATPVDPDKFLFFSSPHKGLKQTVEFFTRLRGHPVLRDVRLYVANPGYRTREVELPEGVVELGPLPWKQVIQELRSAFMVLHYSPVFPETFGLVHAEANAVGTPWISGPQGANPEVCDHPEELADLGRPDSVMERIVAWKTRGRPQVKGNPQFRISRVAREWEDLLSA